MKKKNKFTVLAVPKKTPYVISKEDFENLNKKAESSREFFEESVKRYDNFQNIHIDEDYDMSIFKQVKDIDKGDRCK